MNNINCNSCNRNMSSQSQHRYSQMQRSQYQKNKMYRENKEYDEYLRKPSCHCSSDCMPNNEHVDQMPIAMAYVPWQSFGETYDYDTAFDKGTIFVDLDKPWIGRCMCNE